MQFHYSPEYTPSFEDASQVADFMEYLFSIYGVAHGFRFEGNEWITEEARMLKPEEVRVVNISQGGWEPKFFSVAMKVDPKVMKKYWDFPDIIASSKKFGEILSNPDSDGNVRFQIAVKDMLDSEAAMHEREAYLTLHYNLQLPALTMIHPNGLSGEFPHRNQHAVTIVEEGLQPLDAINLDAFVSEVAGTSVLEKFIDTLAHMHSNQFIHGDTQIRNFGYKSANGQVYVMDPEAHINFRKLPKYSELNQHQKYAIVKIHEISPEEYGTEKHFMKALKRDFLRATDNLRNKGVFKDPRALAILHRALDNYIQKVTEANNIDNSDGSFDQIVYTYFNPTFRQNL